MAPRALILALALAAAAPVAAAGPWDDVAHPNRRRCSQLVADAAKLGEAHEWKAAASAARTAASLCPSDRAVLLHAGETLLGAREYADGRRPLERARALGDAPAAHDDELSLAFLLGFAREVTGDLDGAIEEHRRLEAMGGLPSPNQYLVHYNLGDELMAAGHLGEAIDEYRRAVTLAGAKPVVRLALAVALDRDEQIDQARVELAGVLAFDPELRGLAAEDYVFVPRQDVYYYRALALAERGAVAEARLNLRQFIAELPSSPYVAHARQRLAALEERVDPRELEVSAGVDGHLVARGLGPLVRELEGCFAAGRLTRIKLQVAPGAIHAPPEHPAVECLDRALSRVDARLLATLHAGSVELSLAGRRAAPSAP